MRWVRLRDAARLLRKSVNALRKLIERHAVGDTASVYGIECRKFRGRWHVDLRDWALRSWWTIAEAAHALGRSEEALRRAVERFVTKVELDPADGFELDGMYWRWFGPRCWLVDIGSWAGKAPPS